VRISSKNKILFMGVIYENYFRMGVRVFLCTHTPLNVLMGVNFWLKLIIY